MKKINFALLALLVLSFFACNKNINKAKTNDKTGKILLRQQLKKGDSYTQTVESTQKILIPSMSMEMPMESKFITNAFVSQVSPEGNITTETTYKKIYFKQSNPMTGDLIFDSEDSTKQDEPLSNLKDLKTKKVTIVTAPNGKVLSNDDNFSKQSFSKVNNEFPDTPVAINDTWERTSEIENDQIGKMESINTYKMIDRSNGIVSLEINGKFMMTGKEIGSQVGTIKIDEKTGLTLESSITQKLTMNTQGMDINIESNIKITTNK